MTPIEPLSAKEKVILLDTAGKACGMMDKSCVHTMNTPLHSAFSVFLFNDSGLMLTQQRAFSKLTWPGIWSNACCGHPAPGELNSEAAKRRLREELGIQGLELIIALPDFRYKAVYQGIMENEICPVFISFCGSKLEISPNSTEVEAIKWVSSSAFFQACENPKNTDFELFSPWSLMEGQLLKRTPWIKQLLKNPHNS